MEVKVVCLNSNGSPVLEEGAIYTLGKTDMSKTDGYWHSLKEFPQNESFKGDRFRIALEDDFKMDELLSEAKRLTLNKYSKVHFELIDMLNEKHKQN